MHIICTSCAFDFDVLSPLALHLSESLRQTPPSVYRGGCWLYVTPLDMGGGFVRAVDVGLSVCPPWCRAACGRDSVGAELS